jgi:hypothetical protein
MNPPMRVIAICHSTQPPVGNARDAAAACSLYTRSPDGLYVKRSAQY